MGWIYCIESQKEIGEQLETIIEKLEWNLIRSEKNLRDIVEVELEEIFYIILYPKLLAVPLNGISICTMHYMQYALCIICILVNEARVEAHYGVRDETEICSCMGGLNKDI